MNVLLMPVELPIRLATRLVDDVLSVGRRFETRLEAMDRHLQEMSATLRGMHATLVSIDEETRRLNEGLPGLQRGFELLEPREGTVERVGRIVAVCRAGSRGSPSTTTECRRGSASRRGRPRSPPTGADAGRSPPSW